MKLVFKVGILAVFIKSDDTKTGLSWFQIIWGDEPGENFYLGGPSRCGLHEIHVFPSYTGFGSVAYIHLKLIIQINS